MEAKRAVVALAWLFASACVPEQRERDAAQSNPSETTPDKSIWSELVSRFTDERVEVPKGTEIVVRLREGVSTEKNTAGQRFHAELDAPLTVEGRLLAPAGSAALGELTEVDDAGKVKGRARLALTLRQLVVGNEEFDLATDTLTVVAEKSVDDDLKVIGGSAAVGAVIGAITGGKKGAAIGAGAGAGAGTGYVLATRGDDVSFEPGTRFAFVLTRTIELPVSES
jgi:hypothetical protein